MPVPARSARRSAPRPVRRAAAHAIEQLELRTLLSTTVTLTGTTGNDAFLATIDGGNIDFTVNGSAASGVSQAQKRPCPVFWILSRFLDPL